MDESRLGKYRTLVKTVKFQCCLFTLRSLDTQSNPEPQASDHRHWHVPGEKTRRPMDSKRCLSLASSLKWSGMQLRSGELLSFHVLISLATVTEVAKCIAHPAVLDSCLGFWCKLLLSNIRLNLGKCIHFCDSLLQQVCHILSLVCLASLWSSARGWWCAKVAPYSTLDWSVQDGDGLSETCQHCQLQHTATSMIANQVSGSFGINCLQRAQAKV